MAWFLNFYKCERCKRIWTDDWSCMCDDDCPYCGARHMEPYTSEDLTFISERSGDAFVVYRSPRAAEHTPDYAEIGRFATEEQANAFVEQCLEVDEEERERRAPTS